LIRDEIGVSEILGYTVLVGVVSLAAIGLMTAGMGMLQATENSMEFSGSSGALCSLAQAASAAAETNNTFESVHEMNVPSGYDLIVLDENDDSSALDIYSGYTPMASFRIGSIKMRSPFRSVTFEGGAVIANDSGNIQYLRSPSIRLVRSADGKNAIYINIVSAFSGTFTDSGGAVDIGVRSNSVIVKKFNTEGSVTSIYILCSEPAIWERELIDAGFETSYQDGKLKAVSSEVSNVYVTCANIDFRKV
jgi:hypothetical protein